MNHPGPIATQDDVEALLRELNALDIRLSVEAGELRYDAPPGAFSTALKERVRNARAALLLRLSPSSPQAESEPAGDTGLYPASPAQEGMWLARRDTAENGVYRLTFSIELEAHAHQALVAEALSRIVARHATLRTVFAEVDGALMQKVLPPGPVRLQTHAAQPDTVREVLRQQFFAELAQPFDYERGPLVRFHLVVTGPGHGALMVIADHLIFDGWSIGMLKAELLALLPALASGHPPQLPVLRATFSELARQQRAALEGAEGARADAIWSKRVEKLDIGGFPVDGARAAHGTIDGQRIVVPLQRESLVALERLARAAGTTLTTAWITVLGVLLARHKGNGRGASIGVPFAGRADPRAEHLIGYFVNLLPVGVAAERERPFIDVLREVRNDVMAVLPHQDYPLTRVVEMLRRQRDEVEYAFDAAAVVENTITLEAEDMERAEIDSGAGKFELLFTLMREGTQRAVLAVEYDARLYHGQTVRRMVARLEVLVREAAARPDAPAGRLPLMPVEEQQRILETFNATARPYPRDASLAALFRSSARSHAERVALTEGDAALTYAQLDARTDAVAAGLQQRGVAARDVVALALERGMDAVIATLAVVKSGAAYLPLDRRMPAALVAKLLADARSRLVVSDASMDAALTGLPCGVAVCAIDELAGSGARPAPDTANGGDCAYIMFTSGSTGEPKGVAVPHRGVARLVLNSDYLRLTPEDCMTQIAALGFDGSTLEIWGPLLAGARLACVDDDTALDPPALARRMRSDGVTVAVLTTSLFNRIADERPDAFARLRTLLIGGEAASPPHVLKVLDACPQLQLVNGYGPTENTTFTTTHVLGRMEAQGTALPIGKPVANTRVYIDSEGAPAPIGVWGELLAAGDGLAREYVNQPGLTAAAFTELPWQAGERVYRTGDLARWRHDGVIEFGGRRDGQVKVRGRRIEIEAVETVLARHPGVKNAGVVPVGEGEARVLAALVVADMADEDSWRRHIALALPDYMVPAHFLLVPGIPLTVNGKKDRRRLTALAHAGLAQRPALAGRAPSGDAEVLVARLFASLFPGAQVNAESDFFQLGGHSLAAMRLAGLIERETGRRPAIRALFAGRTVAGIAALIWQDAAAARDKLPRAAGDEWPLASGQARLWMLQRMYPDSGAYNVPAALDLVGELDVDRLSAALIALAERQHALRLRVVPARDATLEARQRLGDERDFAPVMIDFSAESDPKAAAAARLDAEAIRPFRLEHEIPARAILAKLDARHHRLLLVVHHAAFDGWSGPVLLRDLAALYSGDARLAPLMRNYEDYAAWQRAFLASGAGRALMEKWVARLTPLPPPLALPTDRPRRAVRRFHGGYRHLDLDRETSVRLESLAEASGATPFMALLAVVDVLLHRHTGQSDLALGTLVAGRDRAELENLVGFFVNTLVLRQHVAPETTFRALLTAVRATCLEAMAEQDCPFEALVEALRVPRDTSRNPIFDVLAVWQDAKPELPELPGVAMSFADTAFPHVKFDLGFYFWRDDGRIRVQAEFDSDLFDPQTIDALLGRFAQLLGQALESPDRLIRDFDIVTPTERERVVSEFNATGRALDVRRTIPALFLERAAAQPQAAAVLFDETRVGYADFAACAAAIARRLAAAGVQPGDVVALCARRSLAMLAGIHGILLAGAAYAPLDPDQPALRVSGMLEDLGHPAVLASPEHRALFAAHPGAVLELTTDRDANAGAPTDTGGNPDAVAYIIFTSGSTGRPKGAAVEHHAVLNRVLWMQETFPIGPGDVILQKTAITFDVSVWELFWWSWTGAAVALPPPGAEKDPVALVEWIARFGVTVMHFVPSQMAAFLACLEDGRADLARLRSLRYVFASGEALDAGLVGRFNRLLHAAHGTELHNLYGPTEATVDVTWQPCTPWTGGEAVPIGRPIANTRIYVLDADQQPVPPGVPGEIYIGGPQVARGYVNRPELTAERFLADPFVPGGRVYRTGDIGRWRHDGVVLYQGRSDDQVKVRGFRIEAGEIEHALESHPAIARAIVLPVRQAELTELHAYLLPSAALDIAAVRTHLRERVPEYMVPARFFQTDRLPMTSSGKVDRKALHGTPLATATAAPAAPAAAPAADPLEAAVAAIWREVLPGAHFTVQDGFFEAGGNSLLLIRLHERFEARWPGVFSIAELFGCVSIADQARRIAAAGRSAPAPVAAPAVATTEPIAIVGMAVRLADFDDADSFWRDLAAGTDRVRALPAGRADEVRGLVGAMGGRVPGRFREAAYLDDIYGFDPRRFRMSPADATLLDPEQRLFLETALRALEDAGCGGSALDGRKVGVYVGATPSPVFREAVSRAAPDRAEQIFALNVPSNVATRLSFLHDWRGPATLVDTACSSTLTAVHLACRALQAGECEAALVGGAKLVLVPPDRDGRFTIDSSTARTRAFAAGADGTGMGEGAIAFVLKPLSRAQADGDAVHAVILGSAVNQDGASSGMAAPNPAAQAELIRAAAANARIELASLSYVEAHGTGTALGDPIEIDGITRAFSPAEPGRTFIGSVKGNYGHTDAAAGALGLAKAVLCLKHRHAPPQPFFDAPNPHIDFAHAPVRVPTTLTPLPQRGTPLRAGVSSFGLSGINAHVVVEAAPARPAAPPDAATYVVALSAADEAALCSYARAVLDTLRSSSDWSVAGVARTLAAGRSALACRVAFAVASAAELIESLARISAGTAAPMARSVKPNGLAVPARWSDATAAQAAAAAFLGGAELSWPADTPAQRVHLPPAPYTRQRCCPDFGTVTAPFAAATTPLLGAPVALSGGACRRVEVHDAAFWPVAEHRLEGKPTLVGMAMLSLIGDALGRPFAVADLAWLRPLRPDAIEPGSVTLTTHHDGSIAIEGRTGDGRWIAFARAASVAAGGTSPVDLAALRARCCTAVVIPPFETDRPVVGTSLRWDCLREGWTTPSGNEKLARLALPAACVSDLDAYPLHPALLDVAASVALDRPGRVPAGCASVRVFGALRAEVLVHMVRRHATASELVADVAVLDARSGDVLVLLEGLRFASIAPAELPLSLPVWLEAPLADSVRPEAVAVIGEGPWADRLAAALATVGALAGRTGSREPDETVLRAATDFILVPAEGDDLAWRVASALLAVMASLRRPARLLAVAQGAYAVAHQPVSPDAALTAGITLAAAHEEPMLALRYLDVDAAATPEAVFAEFAAFAQAEVGVPPIAALRDGRRLRCFLQPAGEGVVRWPGAGCCVITGGLGGLALSLAEEASAGGAVTLALLARSSRPDADQQQRLDALKARGVTAVLYSCDVAHRASLAATLERVRADIGPITAVVHAAGVADGGYLVNRTREQFENVLAPKVAGTRNLHELTLGDPLEAFVLFGSLTGLTGAPGQTAYSAANAFLDAFAAWREAQGLPGLAIDWCALTDVGMAARLHVPLVEGRYITPAEAPLVWRRALAAGAAQAVVVDAQLLAPQAPVAATAGSDNAGDRAPTAQASAAAAPASTMLEDGLARIWAEVLGYETVGLEDDFYALGGDSISGMKIVNRIVRDLGHGATLTDLFQGATVAGLAAALRGKAGPATGGSGPQPAPEQARYPVAWEQLAVLRAEAAGDLGTAYNLPNLVELPADVHVPRLEAALSRLVERHEILRTSIAFADGDAAMEILPAAPVRLASTQVAPDADLDEVCRALVRRFDLSEGPLARFELVGTADAPRMLFFDIHHALADGRTVELLVADLAALYENRAGAASALQLKDYAWWSRRGEGAAGIDEARRHWLDLYQGPLPLVDLPASRRRPERHTWRGDALSFELDRRTVDALRACAAGQRATPYTVVLAAWAALLHRLCGTSDVVIAVPVDSRDDAGYASVPGMMVSLLPLRLAVDGKVSAAALVEHAQRVNADALRHRAYGLGQLLEDLAPPASPGRTLLSEVTLSYMNFDAAGGADGSFRLHGMKRDSCKGDLGIFVRDVPGRILVSFEYYADLYDRNRMERLGGQFRTLLHAFVTSPQTPVAVLPLLDDAERAWLDAAGRGPQTAYAREESIAAIFARRAAAHPAAPAVTDGRRGWTYGELAGRAAAVAATLAQAGVAPGDIVAVHMERGCEAIAVLLGIVAAGAAYAPLDPASPAERNARILDDLGCRVVVADAVGRDSLPRKTLHVVDGPQAASSTAGDLPAGAGGEQLAYVMYTSGSTGVPKGVMVPHRAVLRLVFGEGLERCNDGDRVLQAGPLAFDASTFEIWGPLLNGGEVCVAGRDALLDPQQFADTLERYAVTRLFVTAALFNRQIDALPSSFRGVCVTLVGGEALSTPHMRRALAACPGTVFANGYGPTENTTFTTIHEIRRTDLEAASIPIGRPLAHTTVCILDAQLQLVAPGVWGEICTGGDGLALGYRNQPGLTAERFVPDPQHPGALLYRTGDLGRWRDDGTVEFGGRLDGQIKLRGFRIELDEIAQALASHPGIGQAAALFLPDTGEIVGCVLPHASPPQEEDLRRWIARALPAYMVPSRLVAVDDMPLNANGKIDRARLHAGLDASRPLPRSPRRVEPPSTDAEAMVAAAFAEIFGRPVDDRRANFLELGGHSLLAIRLVNLISERTGTRIAMSAFFEHPTVEGVAALVDPGAQGGGWIPRAPHAEAYPASHAQRRLYLLDAMDRGSGAYNMTFVWRLGPGFEPEVLRAALAALVRRHETLRTGFAENDGDIVQRVCTVDEVPFAVDDLRGRADAQALAVRLARRELAAPFDLAQPPLARARVLRLGDGDDIVLLVLHHIAADGWSTRVLLRELGALYAAARDGRTAELPPLPIAYRDFAVWQHRHDWTEAAAYWRERLAGAPDRIALPTDRPAPEVQTYRGATARRELAPDIASGLHAVAARTGATAAAVGLALFAALLYRLTRQADMVIGMGVTGRDRAELEGLIGFFVNVLPIRLQLDEEIELDALIGQAHRAMLDALDRRDYPFDMLVRDVAPRRQSNRQPLVNVVFEYQRFADLDAGLAAGAPEGLPATAVVDDAIGRELHTLVDSATAKHDLIVFFQEEGDRARLLMEYDTDMLDRATAERWMDYLADFAAMAAHTAAGAAR